MTQIHVCPLSELETTLYKSKAKWMVSLMGPGKSTPRPAQITSGFLALEFHDIAFARDDLLPPGPEHMGQLLDFFDAWNGKDNLLIHCWMGISRSTAAAAIALARSRPERDMDGLAQQLRTACPMATPNPLMIDLADECLQLNGRLKQAIAKIGRGADASQGVPFSMEVH